MCVYNKKAGTLRVMPAAERGTVFALDQAVKGYAPAVAHGSLTVGSGRAEDEEGRATRVMAAADRAQLLVESFGSKKKQKVMASRAANKVDISRLVGSGDAMVADVARQEGISLDNKKRMEEGSQLVRPARRGRTSGAGARRPLCPQPGLGARRGRLSRAISCHVVFVGFASGPNYLSLNLGPL